MSCIGAELCARLPPAANREIINEENRSCWGRGAIHACMCLTATSRSLSMTTQESSCSGEPGERIQVLHWSFEVNDIVNICEIPFHMFLASAHTFASSFNNDRVTEHSHESEGLQKREVCVRACVCNVHSQHMATEAKYSLSTAGSCFLLLTLDPSQSRSLFSRAHPLIFLFLGFYYCLCISTFLLFLD